MAETTAPVTGIIGYAAYVSNGADWFILLLDGVKPFPTPESTMAGLAAEGLVEEGPQHESVKTFIVPLTVPMIEPVSAEQRDHLARAVYGALSPNWEVGSVGYESAVEAVIAAGWRPPVVAAE